MPLVLQAQNQRRYTSSVWETLKQQLLSLYRTAGSKQNQNDDKMWHIWLMYGLIKSQLSSLDCAVNRFLRNSLELAALKL